MVISILIFLLSLALLTFSSDRFIGAAEKIGLGFGISPFIVGVTVVAFGTSLPELMTSIVSVYHGSSEIVAGNVVGSNITNILLVVGVSAVITGDMIIKRDLIGEDLPMMMASALLLWFALRDSYFSVAESVLFIFALIIFLWSSLKEDDHDKSEIQPKVSWVEYIYSLFGATGIYFGATYTVSSISDISGALGINPAIVSLTALALGTSLPEVVVSVAACKRNLAGMALGNVIGSNVFNTYAVMAIPSLIGPLTIPPAIYEFSLPFMVAVSLLFTIICISKKVSLWQGCLLLIFYGYFMIDLFSQGYVR